MQGLCGQLKTENNEDSTKRSSTSRFFTGRSKVRVHAMIEDFVMHYQARVRPAVRDHVGGTRTRCAMAGRGTADDVG